MTSFSNIEWMDDIKEVSSLNEIQDDPISLLGSVRILLITALNYLKNTMLPHFVKLDICMYTSPRWEPSKRWIIQKQISRLFEIPAIVGRRDKWLDKSVNRRLPQKEVHKHWGLYGHGEDRWGLWGPKSGQILGKKVRKSLPFLGPQKV